ncbi:MAG: hypothetical protein ACM3PF_03090 [Bacteroidota bacterium]
MVLTLGIAGVGCIPAHASAETLSEDPIGPAYAQVDTSSYLNDEDNVPIPPNLLEKELKPDSTSAPARADTTRAPAAADTTAAGRGTVIPANPAQPETLRYVPPGDKMIETKGAPAAGAPGGKPRAAIGAVPPETAAVKKKAGLFGLGPPIVILGLAVIHFMVVKTVTH